MRRKKKVGNKTTVFVQYSEVLERNNRRAVCGIRFRRDTDAGYSSYVEPYTIANSKNEYLAINGNNENLHVENLFLRRLFPLPGSLSV